LICPDFSQKFDIPKYYSSIVQRKIEWKSQSPESCFYGRSITSADVILTDKQLIRPELGKMAFIMNYGILEA
jgi:hypothetical protein